MFELVCKTFAGTDRKLIQETTKMLIDDKLDEYLNHMKSQFRVACFTENNDSPLMWAHYTNSHQGFCMEYDLLKLPEGYRYGILPVIYSDERYDATKALTTLNKNLVGNPFYYKSLHWKYEKEWRMVIPESVVTDGEYYADFQDGVIGIYLGLKSFECHKEKIDKIMEVYSQKGLPVYKIIIEPSSYSLKSVQIN